MPTVSAHVAVTLARHIDHVFGVMGNGNAYFLDALERQTAATYTAVRHEAGASSPPTRTTAPAADWRRPPPPTAPDSPTPSRRWPKRCRRTRPLVLVVGDEPTSGPRPWDVDQIALAAAVGARTYTVGRADAAATTIIAIEHALTYRVPTVLAIPYDVTTLDAGPVPETLEPRLPAPLHPASPFAAGGVADLARTLAGARRPFLLAGHGAWVSGASEALGALADATGAITAGTALGRGVFPRAEFDLGVTGGFGAEGAMELIREADVAVVFGASLNQFTMRFGDLFAPGTRIVQVDVAPAATHPNVGGSCAQTHAVVAEMLVAELAALGATPSGGGSRSTWLPPASAGARRRHRARWSPRPPLSRRAHRRNSCPTTAWSSRTADTSSAGRTCTGPSPPLIA